MSRVVAIANPAGSTGKSTLTAALAHLARQDGRRVLAVDCDPQANLTEWLSASRDTAGVTGALQAVTANDPDAWPGISADEVLADRKRHVQRAVQRVPIGVDLIAADHHLRVTIRRWADLRPAAQEQLVQEALAALNGSYDLVLLDLKGDLGPLAEAGLHAADEVIGVATPTTKALQGLALLAAEVDQLPGTFRSVVPVRIQPRNRGADADDLYALMRATYDGRLTPPVRAAAILEAAYTTGQPVTAYDPQSAVSEDIRAVYAELRERQVLP